MKKGKCPTFPLYASDFLTDTATWTDEEVGVYFRLICNSWVNGGLPDDVERLKNLTKLDSIGFAKTWEFISQKFVKNSEGFFVNNRLEKVRKAKDEFRKKAQKSGKAGAAKRWQKDSEPYTEPNSENMPFHFHIHIKENIKEIIDFLNLKTGKNFKANSDKTVRHVQARLNEGYSVADFKKVIEAKVLKWGKDDKMRDYLRPETLFGPKFESYMNEEFTPVVQQRKTVVI